MSDHDTQTESDASSEESSVTTPQDDAAPDRVEDSVEPDRLALDDECHVRSDHSSLNEDLARSIEKQGVLFPIHARVEDGALRVFDGWQRVQAAQQHNETVPVLVYEQLDETEARAKSLTLNDGVASVRKSVSELDRRASLKRVAEDVPTARQKLGIDDEVAVLRRDLEGVHGVGDRTLADLVDYFGDAAGVRQANVLELQRVSGIGSGTAEAIRDYYLELEDEEVKVDA